MPRRTRSRRTRRRYSRRKGEDQTEIDAPAPKAHIPKSKLKDSVVSCNGNECKLVSKSDNPEECHNDTHVPQDDDLLYCVDPLRAFNREWQSTYKKHLVASQAKLEEFKCVEQERTRNKHAYALEPKLGVFEQMEKTFHQDIVDTYKKFRNTNNLTGALIEVFKIKNQPNSMFKMQYDYFLRQMECLENASILPTQAPGIKMKLQTLISGFDTLLRACRSKEKENPRDDKKSDALGFYVKKGEKYNWQKLGECVGIMGDLPTHNYRRVDTKQRNQEGPRDKNQLEVALDAVLQEVQTAVSKIGEQAT